MAEARCYFCDILKLHKFETTSESSGVATSIQNFLTQGCDVKELSNLIPSAQCSSMHR